MSHIFISYSRKDLSFTQKIVDALASNNLETWVDWKSIPKGEKWLEEIYRGIEEADAFLFLISPDSVKSDNCSKEITHAVKNNKRIIPLVVRDADSKIIPSVISERNWIFCRYETDQPEIMIDNFDAAIKETCETINTDHDWLRYHTRLQVKALEWERTKDTSQLLRGKELREADERLAVSHENPQPTENQRQYILSSSRNETRRQRRTILASMAALIISAILGILAFINGQSATKNANSYATQVVLAENAQATAEANQKLAEEQALIANSRHLAAVAQTELDTRTDRALLLAAESAKMNRNFSTLDGLLSVLSYEPVPYTFFFGHEEPVTALAFSVDNKLLASASEDLTVRIWNIDPGKTEALIETGFAATALTFSPDRKYLVIGIEDTVQVWDIKKSGWMGQFSTGHAEDLLGFAFTREGKKLAVGYSDGTVLIFDFKSANLDMKIEAPSSVEGLAFNQDGTLLAGGHAVEVFLWDAKTGELINDWYEYGGFAEGLRFNSDNELHAYGSWQNILQIREVETGEIIRSFENRVEWFSVESLSSDGKWLATSGYSEWVGVIFLWDVSGSQQMSFAIENQSDKVSCLGFSPSSQYLVVSSGNNDIHVWDKNKEFQYPLMLEAPIEILCAKFYSNDQIVAFSKDNNLHRFDINTKKQIGVPLSVDHEILHMDVLMDTKKLVAVTTCLQKEENRCIEEEIQFFDIELEDFTKSVLFETNGGNTNISPKGNLFAVASPEPEFNIRLWDLSSDIKTDELLHGPFNWVLDIQFSPDETKLAASVQADGLIYLWDLTSNQHDGNLLMGHDYMAPALVFSRDGKLLVSGGCSDRSGMGCSAGEIRIWDVDSKQLIGKPLIGAHENWIGRLAFSPDGTLLVSSDFDGVIKGWPIGFDAWIQKACQRAGRNFTQDEWQQYFPTEEYRITCPQWPAGE